MTSQAGYYEAIRHRSLVHKAITIAAPYSITILAYAVDFVYSQGFLCYRFANEIRVLDVHCGGRHEFVLNLQNILPPYAVFSMDDIHNPAARVKLIHYNDGLFGLRVKLLHSDALLRTYLHRPDMTQQMRLITVALNVSASATVFMRYSQSHLW